MKKVKVYLKPGPWEGFETGWGYYVIEDELRIDDENRHDRYYFHPDSQFIDRIEPMPDYDQWIRDKVPVIGWQEQDSSEIIYRFGILISLPNKETDYYGIQCGSDKQDEWEFPNVCLHTKEAIEALQRGERP